MDNQSFSIRITDKKQQAVLMVLLVGFLILFYLINGGLFSLFDSFSFLEDVLAGNIGFIVLIFGLVFIGIASYRLSARSRAELRVEPGQLYVFRKTKTVATGAPEIVIPKSSIETMTASVDHRTQRVVLEIHQHATKPIIINVFPKVYSKLEIVLRDQEYPIGDLKGRSNLISSFSKK